MKSFFAGMLGGMCVLIVFLLVQPSDAASTEATARTVSLLNRPAGTALPTPIDLVPAAERARPAVVHIRASSGRREQERYNDPFRFFFGNPFEYGPREGSGSGIVFSADGYIVTNNHVIDRARELTVTTFDNREYAATVVGTYPESDLAVLKIDAENLPTLRHANPDRARVGEWVLAVGNPFDLTSTVTAGIISAKGRDIDIIGGQSPIEAFIQTDAAVNPGNSGGALVTANGELLGMNTAISTRTGSFEGYSFAIPIDLLANIADEIIQTGGYQRASLGIDAYDLDTEAAAELGVDFTQGVVVMGVLPGSAAQRAGLQRHDIIVGMDGEVINSAPQLQQLVNRRKVGERTSLTVVRAGREITLPLELGAG